MNLSDSAPFQPIPGITISWLYPATKNQSTRIAVVKSGIVNCVLCEAQETKCMSNRGVEGFARYPRLLRFSLYASV